MIPSPALQECTLKQITGVVSSFIKCTLVSLKDFAAPPRKKQVMG